MSWRNEYSFRPLTMGVHIINPKYEDFHGQAMVTFSYDDGYMDNYTLALPIHEKYRAPGTFNLVTRHQDRVVPIPHRFHKFHTMDADRRGAEIASHSHTHANFTEISEEELEFELQKSYDVLSELANRIETIAIPGSAYNSSARTVMENSPYFAARGLEEQGGSDRYNVYGEIDRLWLTSHPLTAPTTFSRVKDIIDEAVADKKWCILMLHGIDERDPVGVEMTAKLLDQTLEYIYSFSKDDLLCVNKRDGIRFAKGLGDY